MENLWLVMTAYPKSGSSWVTSMLGDALSLPKRDIYVDDNFKLFDVRKHPWYKGATSLEINAPCVIKSHELPNSSLIAFPAKFAHLVRDGRDVVVSKFFYEKQFCVENGLYLYESFEESFDEYLPRVATEWRDYISAWMSTDIPMYKYENFLKDPSTTLKALINNLGIEIQERQIALAVKGNEKEAFSQSLDETFQYNTFVRAATMGDWRNHFSRGHMDIFKHIAGETLISLSYERDLKWSSNKP